MDVRRTSCGDFRGSRGGGGGWEGGEFKRKKDTQHIRRLTASSGCAEKLHFSEISKKNHLQASTKAISGGESFFFTPAIVEMFSTIFFK